MGDDLNGVLDEVEKQGSTMEETREELQKKYGLRFDQAEKLVASMAVKKYVFKPSGKIVWIVVGRKKEYFVIPKLYCQCDDFYINVVIRRKMGFCYHLFAQAIAEKRVSYEIFDVPDSDFKRLNNEWKKQSV